MRAPAPSAGPVEELEAWVPESMTNKGSETRNQGARRALRSAASGCSHFKFSRPTGLWPQGYMSLEQPSPFSFSKVLHKQKYNSEFPKVSVFFQTSVPQVRAQTLQLMFDSTCFMTYLYTIPLRIVYKVSGRRLPVRRQEVITPNHTTRQKLDKLKIRNSSQIY